VNKSAKLPLTLGIVCISLGLLLNEVTLERTIVPDGQLTSVPIRMLVVVWQSLLAVLGLYLLVKQPHIPVANIVLVTSSTLFSVLVGTVTLQVLFEPTPIKSGWRSSLSLLRQVHKLDKNQLGFRGQPINYSDDDFVILLLGDSQAEAIYCCAYGWMPERRLEHYIKSEHSKKVRVFTLAASGYGQDQQLLVLKEYFRRYRADLVVLWQTPSNDVCNNMFPTSMPANGTPKPTFVLKNGELNGPSEQMGQELQTPALKLMTLWHRVFSPPARDDEWEKYLPEPYLPMVAYDGGVNQTWQQAFDNGTMGGENLNTEKANKAIYLTPRIRRMVYGLELTRRLLQEIQQQVSAQNGKFVIFRVEDDLAKKKDWNEEVYVLNGKYYKASKAQREENILYMNHSFDQYVVPVTVEDGKMGSADAHLNEHATDQVMKDLAYNLVNLIPDRSSKGTTAVPK
jgi:hypothetical protein